jgi:hypothetical protein
MAGASAIALAIVPGSAAINERSRCSWGRVSNISKNSDMGSRFKVGVRGAMIEVLAVADV